MPKDYQTQLSTAQALTGTSAIVSENTYDLGAAGTDVGAGSRIDGEVVVTAAGGTSPTLSVAVIQSANADLSSPDVLLTMPAKTTAVGLKVPITIPPGVVTKRYVGFQYTQAGTSPTATVNAWLGGAVQSA